MRVCALYLFQSGSKVRQFHQEGDTVTAEYFLGKSNLATQLASATTPTAGVTGDTFDANEPVIKTFVSPEHTNPIPYYSVQYTDGTPCDLTGTPRYV
jgi:hypothetical protein